MVGDNVCLYARGTGAAQLADMGIDFRDASELKSPVEAIRRGAPWAVLVGTSENPDTTAFDLIDAAHAAGVPSIGAVDNAANAGFRFRGRSNNPLAHAPYFLLLTDEMARRNFITLGFSEERIFVCGHPYHDTVREAGRAMEKEGRDVLRSRLFPDAGFRPTIVFLGEISGGLDTAQYFKTDNYTLYGRGQSTGRTQIVIEEFLDVVAGMEERPYLVLRPHPKNTDLELGRYYKDFDQISRGGNSLETVYSADLVVGMSTSLLVEAVLLQRPTLSILPRVLERDWLLTTAVGITPSVTRRADIKPALTAALDGYANFDVEALIPSGAVARVLSALDYIKSGSIRFSKNKY